MGHRTETLDAIAIIKNKQYAGLIVFEEYRIILEIRGKQYAVPFDWTTAHCSVSMVKIAGNGLLKKKRAQYHLNDQFNHSFDFIDDVYDYESSVEWFHELFRDNKKNALEQKDIAEREEERLKRERQEAEARRLEEERLERERQEAEARRLEEERLERERQEAEVRRLEEERLEKERQEAEARRLEEERLERERQEAEARRLEEERLERERQEAEARRLEEERLERERQEAEARRLEEERLKRERQEAVARRLEEERLERERQEAEACRLEEERLERERQKAEARRLEEERLEKERQEAEARRLEEERLEKERQEAEQRRLEEERRREELRLEKRRVEEERIRLEKLREERKRRLEGRRLERIRQEKEKNELRLQLTGVLVLYLEKKTRLLEEERLEKERQEAETRRLEEERLERERQEAEARRREEEQIVDVYSAEDYAFLARINEDSIGELLDINPDKYRKKPVSALIVSRYLKNRLKGKGIVTIQDLLKLTPSRLKDITRLGNRRLPEFVDSLVFVLDTSCSEENVDALKTILCGEYLQDDTANTISDADSSKQDETNKNLKAKSLYELRSEDSITIGDIFDLDPRSFRLLPVEDMHVSKFIGSLLLRRGFDTLGKILEASPSKLNEIRGIGNIVFHELELCLTELSQLNGSAKEILQEEKCEIDSDEVTENGDEVETDVFMTTDSYRTQNKTTTNGVIGGFQFGFPSEIYTSFSWDEDETYLEHRWPASDTYYYNALLNSREVCVLKNDLMAINELLSGPYYKRLLNFDLSESDYIMREIISYWPEDKQKVLRREWRSLIDFSFISRISIDMTDDRERVLEYVNIIETIKEKKFEKRADRLKELISAMVHKPGSEVKLLYSKKNTLRTLIRMIWGECDWVDTGVWDKETGEYSRLIDIVYFCITEKKPDCSDHEKLQRISDNPLYKSWDYYYNFTEYFITEVFKEKPLKLEKWDKARLIEDNPTYFKFSELKPIVEKNFDIAVKSKDEISIVLGKDKYARFVEFCNNNKLIYMRDLLTCNLKDLYYYSETIFEIPQRVMTEVVYEFGQWLRSLESKEPIVIENGENAYDSVLGDCTAQNTDIYETEEDTDNSLKPLLSVIDESQGLFKGIKKATQKSIIQADPADRILINAGPGTGKTWTLIEKIIYMVNENEVDAETIQVLCFSRAAVDVIRKRIDKEIEKDPDRVEIKRIDVRTFDSFASQLLYWLRESEYDIIPENFQIEALNYEERIEKFVDVINEEPDLISECRHLIVDEVQDLVLARCDMVLDMIRNLSEECGVTLFGDACQAIYDYQLSGESRGLFTGDDEQCQSGSRLL